MTGALRHRLHVRPVEHGPALVAEFTDDQWKISWPYHPLDERSTAQGVVELPITKAWQELGVVVIATLDVRLRPIRRVLHLGEYGATDLGEPGYFSDAAIARVSQLLNEVETQVVETAPVEDQHVGGFRVHDGRLVVVASEADLHARHPFLEAVWSTADSEDPPSSFVGRAAAALKQTFLDLIDLDVDSVVIEILPAQSNSLDVRPEERAVLCRELLPVQSILSTMQFRATGAAGPAVDPNALD